jgi:hypothetical protein
VVAMDLTDAKAFIKLIAARMCSAERPRNPVLGDHECSWSTAPHGIANDMFRYRTAFVIAICSSEIKRHPCSRGTLGRQHLVTGLAFRTWHRLARQ